MLDRAPCPLSAPDRHDKRPGVHPWRPAAPARRVHVGVQSGGRAADQSGPGGELLHLLGERAGRAHRRLVICQRGTTYGPLPQPNEVSSTTGGTTGFAPGGGDTDLATAPAKNSSGTYNVYVALFN